MHDAHHKWRIISLSMLFNTRFPTLLLFSSAFIKSDWSVSTLVVHGVLTLFSCAVMHWLLDTIYNISIWYSNLEFPLWFWLQNGIISIASLIIEMESLKYKVIFSSPIFCLITWQYSAHWFIDCWDGSWEHRVMFCMVRRSGDKWNPLIPFCNFVLIYFNPT